MVSPDTSATTTSTFHPPLTPADHGTANVYSDTKSEVVDDLLLDSERRDSFLLPSTTMEKSNCHVLYVDRRVESTGPVDKSSISKISGQNSEVKGNLDSLLNTFPTVATFSSGRSCLARITDLESKQNSAPVIVMIHVPAEEGIRSQTSSSPVAQIKFFQKQDAAASSEIYGLQLLSHIVSETRLQRLSKLIIPFILASGFNQQSDLMQQRGHNAPLLLRFMDAGAVDVFVSPITKERTDSLVSYAYKAFKENSKTETQMFSGKHRERKLSWMGVDEEKPFGYLRESMVSSLMLGICSPEKDLELVGVITSSSPKEWEDSIPSERKAAVAKAVGLWSFSAHDFSDDELMYGSLMMLKHTLSMPGLTKWRLSHDELIQFLQACRSGYNNFVHYHNFRHVIDVLQAVFYFLLSIDIIPPYPASSSQSSTKAPSPSSLASLLSPTDALILLISAVGHDLGHPGVNNAFLVSLNAPLAQLYNDRSVLESFHCAAYSQILRRYWPAIFKDSTMRKSNVNIILATDMGVHFKYMADLGSMNAKLAKNPDVSTWEAKDRDEAKDLVSGWLIKCADISNVARLFDVARQWANILTDEFANQGVMEEELGIPTCLFGGPPSPGDLMKLGESQMGFTSVFALPLFEGVAKLLPGMRFGVDELSKNKDIWSNIIAQEKEKLGEGLPSKGDDAGGSSTNANSRKQSIVSSIMSSEKTPTTAGSLPIPSEDQSSSVSLVTQKGNALAAGSGAVTAVALPLSQQLEAMSSLSSASPGSPPSQPLPEPPVSSQNLNDRPRSISPNKKLRKKRLMDKPDLSLDRRPSSPTLASGMLGGQGSLPVSPLTSTDGPNGVTSFIENGHGNGNGNGNGNVLKSHPTADTATTATSTLNSVNDTVSNSTSKATNDLTNPTSLATTTTSTNKSATITPKKKKSRRSLWLGEHFSKSHEDVPPVPSQNTARNHINANALGSNESPNSSEEGFHHGNGNGHVDRRDTTEETQGHSMPGWKKLLFRRKNKKEAKANSNHNHNHNNNNAQAGGQSGFVVQNGHGGSGHSLSQGHIPSQESSPGQQQSSNELSQVTGATAASLS